MDPAWRQRQGALADVEGQPQLGDGLYRRPAPVRRTREALNRFDCTDLARRDRAEPGKECIQLDLTDADSVQEVA
jgi:hypothetical protein